MPAWSIRVESNRRSVYGLGRPTCVGRTAASACASTRGAPGSSSRTQQERCAFGRPASCRAAVGWRQQESWLSSIPSLRAWTHESRLEGALIRQALPGHPGRRPSRSGHLSSERRLGTPWGRSRPRRLASAFWTWVRGLGSLRGRLEGPRLAVDSLDLRAYGGAVSGAGRALGRRRSEPSRLERPGDRCGGARGLHFRRAAAAREPRRRAPCGWSFGAGRSTRSWVRARLLSGPPETAGWPVAGPARLRLSGRGVDFSADALEVRDARLSLDGLAQLRAGAVADLRLRPAASRGRLRTACGCRASRRPTSLSVVPPSPAEASMAACPTGAPPPSSPERP